MSGQDVPVLGSLCLDTGVYSLLKGGQRCPHPDLALWHEAIRGKILVISFAVAGELWGGAVNARLGERRLRELERTLREDYVVLTPTHAVMRKFGELHACFRDRIKGGGVNDMWTAACALAQPESLPVATTDLRDFSLIAKEFPLRVVNPSLGL